VSTEISPIAVALGEHFGCDPASIGRWALVCERDTDDGPVSSSAWAGVPHWQVLGLVDELRAHIEQQRRPLDVASTNGKVTT
jgi:hypothetical protein